MVEHDLNWIFESSQDPNEKYENLILFRHLKIIREIKWSFNIFISQICH